MIYSFVFCVTKHRTSNIMAQKNVKLAGIAKHKVDSIIHRLTMINNVSLPISRQAALTNIVTHICKNTLFPLQIVRDNQWVIIYHILHTLKSIEDPEEIVDMHIREQARRVTFNIPLRELTEDERTIWIKKRKHIVAGLCNRFMKNEDGDLQVRPITVSLLTGCSEEEDVIWWQKTHQWVVGLGMGDLYPRADIQPSWPEADRRAYEGEVWDPFIGICK